MKTVVHITTVHNAFDNRIFYKECIGLVEGGYIVVLIAPHDKNEVVENVTIIALTKAKNRLMRMFLLSWQAYKKVIRVNNASIIHFHDPELIPIGLLLKFINRKKVIYDIHEDYLTSIAQKKYLPVNLRPFIVKFFDGFEKIFANKFSIVLAEKYYSTRFPKGTHVLNYPKKSQFVAISSDKNYLPFPKLIYTGNVTEDRGALIHASIISALNNASVTFVGNCSKEVAEEIYELAEDSERVSIYGVQTYIPFTTIVEFYKKESWTAGLAVFPPTRHYSNKELTKLFEYMGAGIPIICSDFPAWRKLIESTGTGICVNPLDVDEICNAINYLVDNPAEAKQMGDNGREKVLYEFNWERELVKLIALYENMLNE